MVVYVGIVSPDEFVSIYLNITPYIRAVSMNSSVLIYVHNMSQLLCVVKKLKITSVVSICIAHIDDCMVLSCHVRVLE